MHEDLDLWFELEIYRHERGLRQFIRNLLRSIEGLRKIERADVDEVLQDVYMRVWTDAVSQRKANGALKTYEFPKAYVYQIARNLIIDRARRKGVLRFDPLEESQMLDALVDEITPERSASNHEELVRLKACFDKLPYRRREAVWLRKVEGLSQKDVAVHMQITVGTVAQTVLAGMIQLIRCFGSDEPESEEALLQTVATKHAE